MDSGQLIVTIGANIDKLREEVEKAHSVIGGLGEFAVEVGQTLAVAFGVEKMAEFSAESYKVAASFQEDMIRMKYATHGNTQSLDELKETAEKLSKSSWFSGEDLVKQETRLAIMGRSQDQIKGIVEAATQMSAALGLDLATSVDALNKSLNGVGKALVNIDPSFKALTEDQLKNGDAVELARKKYGDIAKELSEGSSGAIAQHKKAVEELSRSYGEFLEPAIDSSYRGLAAFMDFLNKSLFHKTSEDDNISDLNDKIRTFNSLNREHAGKGFIEDAYDAMAEAAKKANKDILILTDGVKKMASIKPEPIKFVDGSKSDQNKKEELDLNTIGGLQEKIKKVEEDRLTAKGLILIRDNDELHQLREQLKVLENIRTINNNMGNGSVGLKDNSTFSKQKDDLEKSMREISAIMPKLTGDANMNMKKVWHDNLQELKKNQAEARKEYLETAKAAQMAGAEMADAFIGVVAGQESLAQGLGKVASTIVNDMMKRAMAAQMAKTAESSPPYIAIALMAAAAAAISALFSSIGGSEHAGGGGGGGGESSSAGSRYADSGMKPYYANNPMAINLNASLSVNGTGLSAVIRKQTYLTKITGG